MVLPKQKEIEIPLLKVLIEIGGQGKTKNVYDLVTQKFPQLREEDILETLSSGGNRWKNRIQWARQSLIQKGDMTSPSRGIWAITDKGRKRITGKEEIETAPGFKKIETETSSFVEMYDEYESSFRSQLLDNIYELTPHQFEQFARKILQAYGFIDLKVTNVSSDGGIDGYGKLRLGLASMNVAYQCKRWEGNVGRPEVDKFRGAIQGEFEQGIFFATSDFSSQARDASLKKGAVPIILLNGESILDLMIQKEIGVQKVPLYQYYDRPIEFTEEEK